MNIVFEDSEILVINKADGLVVNRSGTIHEETLQDQLSGYFGLENSLGIGDRAGIVHRLDRETSGLLVVAKTQKSFEDLQLQFKNRKVVKKYIALVHGLFNEKTGSIDTQIVRVGKFGKFAVAGKYDLGKEAKTEFELEATYGFSGENFEKLIEESGLSKSRINYLRQNALKYSLVYLFPKTGRTHQIRVHVKSIGHPVVSDLIYTPRKLLKFDLLWCPRLFLHASQLEFMHPRARKQVKFSSPLPNELKNAILNLERLTQG